MKKCPQCRSVYTFETVYCLNDGTPLIDDRFPLPSEFPPETETVISNRPVFTPPTVAPVSPQTSSGFGKSFLFLVIGLLIGGGLVLGVIFLIIAQMQKPATPTANSNAQTTASNRHKEPNKTRKDSEFNGFVQVENGNLRSGPNGATADILPKNDRVNMLERDGAWYRVICEHGVGGWMHGDNLDWQADAIRF